MNRLRRLFRREKVKPSPNIIPLTEQDIDMSLRIFWTKIAREWDIERIRQVKTQILAVIKQVDFEKNLLERRYVVEGLIEESQQRYSGASLLALLEVLDTLERLSAHNKE
ncbi:MAG: hypothetical protein CUN55_13685 [Phototrophicales bacterium]|nr:MAG: hypothetical protein CUN55_13685 [Phototrophicales bacterium]